MKRLLLPVVILALATSAFRPLTDAPIAAPSSSSDNDLSNTTSPAAAPVPAQRLEESGLTPADEPNSYWVINPASGSRLFVRAHYPRGWTGESLPALILVPGALLTTNPHRALIPAAAGFLVITFDPEGRGRSEGVEDFNGHVGQDGLAAVIRAVASLPGLDTDRYGLVSFSFGIALSTGALARHPDLPIDFYIDWEGPLDRETTSKCQTQLAGHVWQPCGDETWWSEREARNFIADIRVPYQRIQSQTDHYQSTNLLGVELVNAAVAGGLPWVRLNNLPANQTYELTDPPAMLPDSRDKQIDRIIAFYAWYIIQNVL